jgi:hypothetical protein
MKKLLGEKGDGETARGMPVPYTIKTRISDTRPIRIFTGQ